MKNKLSMLIFLALSGCSFFEPVAEVDHEQLALQYQNELSRYVDFDIVKSVKSHKCDFIEYQEPEFKADAIFKCEIVLENANPKYEDFTDIAILKRYGINEAKTAKLEESVYIKRIADKAFEKEMQARLGSDAQ